MKTFKRFLSLVLAVCIVLSMSVSMASAAGTVAYGAGTVSATCLNIRSGPSTSDSIVGTVIKDARLVIMEKTSSVWYKVNYNGTIGYVACRYLTDVLTRENFTAIGRLNGTGVRMRSGPSTSHDILGTYNLGATFTVIGINEGWYKVRTSAKTGYIRSDYIDIISGHTANDDPNEAPEPNSELGQQVVDYAMQFLGCNYVYGGSSPSGFDCSGFVKYIYAHFGYDLFHGATTLYNTTGVSVSKAELAPGDLVFFASNGVNISHVGLYIGGGEFIHASTSTTGVIISDLNTTYYERVWFGAKRILE